VQVFRKTIRAILRTSTISPTAATSFVAEECCGGGALVVLPIFLMSTRGRSGLEISKQSVGFEHVSKRAEYGHHSVTYLGERGAALRRFIDFVVLLTHLM
jgi:hypothetical protein